MHKHRDKSKFSEEENLTTIAVVAEKTIGNLKRLGDQKFAVSPFRQYFDDWLVNLTQTLIEFESNPAVSVDEEFERQREQMLAKVESELAGLKKEEEKLESCIKELADTNHQLVELDADYAKMTQATSKQRNAEIQRMTQNVRNLETELVRVKDMKTSFFGGLSKKAKEKRETETNTNLKAAKAELEKTIELFRTDQEKLHDGYEKKKQTIIEKVQLLEREIERLEIDNSINLRHSASEAIAKAARNLLERQPKTSTETAE